MTPHKKKQHKGGTDEAACAVVVVVAAALYLPIQICVQWLNGMFCCHGDKGVFSKNEKDFVLHTLDRFRGVF